MSSQFFIGANLPPPKDDDPLGFSEEGRQIKHYCGEICKFRKLAGFAFTRDKEVPWESAIQAALTAVRFLDSDKIQVGHGKHEFCRL